MLTKKDLQELKPKTKPVPKNVQDIVKAMSKCGIDVIAQYRPKNTEYFLPECCVIDLDEDVTLYFDMKGKFTFLVNTKE